jgi:hypothetical protein
VGGLAKMRQVEKRLEFMKNIKKLLLYGFLLWLIPFLLSNFIFMLKESDPIFFETLMGLILALTTAGLLYRYNNSASIAGLKDGLILGVVWMAISLFFDFFIFVVGPLAMPAAQYLREIGMDYLLIVIMAGLVGLLKHATVQAEQLNPQGEVEDELEN